MKLTSVLAVSVSRMTINLRFFIAVPLGNGQECSDPFNRPDLFHIVDVDYETAERIGSSPFSSAASEETDKYPIELFEDPFFDPSDVGVLLKCLEEWRSSLQEEDNIRLEDSLTNRPMIKYIGSSPN